MYKVGENKSEMHRMTPSWTWTLNGQKYSIYTKYLPPDAQILVRFAIRLGISEIQHVQGRWKWIGNAPNDPKLNLNT